MTTGPEWPSIGEDKDPSHRNEDPGGGERLTAGDTAQSEARQVASRIVAGARLEASGILEAAAAEAEAVRAEARLQAAEDQWSARQGEALLDAARSHASELVNLCRAALELARQALGEGPSGPS